VEIELMKKIIVILARGKGLTQRFRNFFESGPTCEYLGNLATHWMKWVQKIASWIVVKICPF